MYHLSKVSFFYFFILLYLFFYFFDELIALRFTRLLI